MVPLQLDGIEKVKAGIISVEEVLRTATITDSENSE
jgi:type II secretory ATPase GspE/PulE/Tfp pilus assembly ATPase PilB-like protein